MGWRRLGHVFAPSGQFEWMRSHASVPYAEHIEGDLFRIYFSPRDGQNRSHLAWLELDITRPEKILRLADTPVLGPGAPGAFDDCGTMGSWSVVEDGKRHHFYIGWNIRQPMPFHVSIGLAVEPLAGGAVERMQGPILDRTPIDPWFCSNPCVIREGGMWRMWYLGGRGWEATASGPSASYDVRYAESEDGVTWRRDGRTAVGFSEPDEIAIARPCVVRTGEGYEMWFSYRGRGYPYRLGLARSADGVTWSRDPDMGDLHPAQSGWDSEMIAYPFVFNHGAQRYLLYCGAGFGRTGFGLAVWEA